MSKTPANEVAETSVPEVAVDGVLKKITPKSVFGDIKAHMKATKKAFLVMRVMGTVGKIRSVTTQYGDAPALIGSFEAIRGTDGQIFTSTRCFLPQFITDEIEASFNGGEQAQFALDLYAKPEEEKSQGYEFVAQNLIAPANPLAALKQSIKDKPLMIENKD